MASKRAARAYLRGAGTVLDLRGRSAVTGRYVKVRDPGTAALARDWKNVGAALQHGMNRASGQVRSRRA
jgi:hypothetical protein